MLSGISKGWSSCGRISTAAASLGRRCATSACVGSAENNTQGDTLVYLSEVLTLARRPAEAASILEQAASRFELKGNLVSLERVRPVRGR